MNNKIFISSTCFDLIDLRAELFAYLKDSGLNPVMSDQMDSEFLTFHDQNSIETCLMNLRESDLVIIILSQRYGPTLEKAGFEAVSATHLEYKEAVKTNKRIILFVRDRLEAEFNIYQKSGDLSSLTWIKGKDAQLFELLRTHKKLANTNTNNWYWTFKNSVEVKARLEVELGASISEIKLNNLIKSGNVPFVTTDVEVTHALFTRGVIVKLTAENLGSHPAIEPFMLIYAAENYDDVFAFEQNRHTMENYYISIPSLRPGERGKTVEFEFPFNNQRVNSGIHHFIVEVSYKNPLGDYLTDVTKIEAEVIRTTEYQKFEISKSFIIKRLRDESAYQQVVSE